jgi:hypothetical protein
MIITKRYQKITVRGELIMKLKYLTVFTVTSLLSLGMVTGCGTPDAGTADPCAGKSEAVKSDPCAGKADPCAGKADPCAGKADPCAGN